jgi:hypothetical protein
LPLGSRSEKKKKKRAAQKAEQKESISKIELYKEHESPKKAEETFKSNLIKEPQSNKNIFFERESEPGKSHKMIAQKELNEPKKDINLSEEK